MSDMARRIYRKQNGSWHACLFSNLHAGIDEECGIVGKG